MVHKEMQYVHVRGKSIGQLSMKVKSCGGKEAVIVKPLFLIGRMAKIP